MQINLFSIGFLKNNLSFVLDNFPVLHYLKWKLKWVQTAHCVTYLMPRPFPCSARPLSDEDQTDFGGQRKAGPCAVQRAGRQSHRL